MATDKRDNRNLNAALGYARHGWPVHPLVPGAKGPATEHGFKDATTDQGQIRDWWAEHPDRNIGVATGAPGPDVVDVDKAGDVNGFANYNRLHHAGLVPDPMLLVRTPRGGFHAYFNGTGQGNGSLRGQHIDFRSKGGYIVVPPSAVNGKLYQVIKAQPSDTTVNWQAIHDHLVPQPHRQPAATHRHADTDPDRRLDRLTAWYLREARPGDRNFPLFYAAKQAIEGGADPAAVRERLMDAAHQAGLAGGAAEATRTIDSAFRSAGQANDRPFGQRAPSGARSAADPAPQPAAPAPEPARTPEKGTEPMTANPELLKGEALDAEIDRLAAQYREPVMGFGEQVRLENGPEAWEGLQQQYEAETGERAPARDHTPEPGWDGPGPPPDMLSPHAASDIPDAPDPGDALDNAHGAPEARSAVAAALAGRDAEPEPQPEPDVM